MKIDFLKYKRIRNTRGVQSNISNQNRDDIDNSNTGARNANEDRTFINLLIDSVEGELNEYDHNINHIFQEKNESMYDENIKILLKAYEEKEIFSYFTNFDDYQDLFNYLMHNTNNNNSTVKLLIDSIFEKDLNKNIFSLNKLENLYSRTTVKFYYTSLFTHILKLLETIFNQNEDIRKICIFGEKGIGKSYALLMYILILRLNPFNIVLTISNFEELKLNPLLYFSNEVLISLYFAYLNNSALDIKDLEIFYDKFTSNSDILIRHAIEDFKILINKVLAAYNENINIYFIIDNYDKFFSENERNKNSLKNAYGSYNDNKHLELIELLENFSISEKLKIIVCSNLDNNDLVINKFKEFKNIRDFELLDKRMIFLNSSIIIKSEELYNFIEKKFGFANRNVMKNIVKYSGYNFNLLCNYFLSNPRYDEFNFLRENHIRGYFIDIKLHEFNILIDDVDISLEKKAYSLYSLYSYKSNLNSNYALEHSKYEFFSKELYKNYIYRYILPEKNDSNIILKFENDLVTEFLMNFNYDFYFKKIKLKNLSLKSYSNWYNMTNDQFLKGHYIEELAFLSFKNCKQNLNPEITIFFHKIDNINYYSRADISRNDEDYENKINNSSNLRMEGKVLLIRIEKIKKFYSQDDEIFGGDKIIKARSGIYFLPRQFPVIDALIINQERKNLILVQIKKTMKQKYIVNCLDDFQILYFLLANEDAYRRLKEIQLQQNNNEKNLTITTKLQFFMKIAHYIKSGWSINFLFTYSYIDNTFDVITDNQIFESYYDRGSTVAHKINLEEDSFKYSQQTMGLYKIEPNSITIFRNKIMHNIIIVHLNDFTSGLIEGKKFSHLLK